MSTSDALPGIMLYDIARSRLEHITSMYYCMIDTWPIARTRSVTTIFYIIIIKIIKI